MIGLLILYILFFLISIYFILKSKNLLNGFFFFNVGYSIYYILIPLMNLFLIYIGKDGVFSYMMFIRDSSLQEYFTVFLKTCLVYLLFLFFYFFVFNNKDKSKRISLEYLKSEKVYMNLMSIGIICLLVGLFAELVIIKSFGGIINSLSMAEKLRAYGVDRSDYMPQNLLFVNILAGITLVSPFIFKFLLSTRKSINLKAIYIISMFSSVFFLLFFAGRLPILLFVSCFLIQTIFNHSKKPWLVLIILGILMFFSVSLLEDLLFYLSYGYVKVQENTGIIRQINDYSFPYSNLLAVEEMNNLFGFRKGIDFFTWIINITPIAILRLFGLSKVTSGYEYLTKYYDPSGVTLGGTPTDFITLGERQFPILGLLLMPFLYALVCRLIDNNLEKINYKRFLFIKIRIATIMFIVVPYADYDSFIRNRFDMIILLIIMICLGINKKRV